MDDLKFKIHWSNSPIPINQLVSNPPLVFDVPLGLFTPLNGGSGSVSSVNGKVGTVVLNAADVGADALGTADAVQLNVDALADIVDAKADVAAVNQSLSLKADTAVVNQSLSLKADAAAVNQALSTKADLINGLIPASQLPSFVDDVLEYANLASFPALGESAKIYIAVDTNKTYRWAGSSFAEIGGGSLALGETVATAYRGDRGKIAYDHSLSQGNPHNTTTSEINEGAKLFFTEPRVRNTVLTGLVTNNSANVTNTDTVEVAIGKLQAKSAQSGSSSQPTWVDISTLAGYTKHANIDAAGTKIELSKQGGMIWVRGYLTVSTGIGSGNTELFSITDTNWLWDYASTEGTNYYTYYLNLALSLWSLGHIQLSVQQAYTNTSPVHKLRIVADAALGPRTRSRIQTVCIGKALNP